MKQHTAHEVSSQSLDVFNSPEMFVAKFDSPERNTWQRPDEVIRSFNLTDDSIVVEIGAGTGYFAVRLAEFIKNGKIVCFEQAPKMAEYLENRLKELRLNNVAVRTDGSDGILVLEKQADLIFSVDVYHHIQDRISFFTHAAQSLSIEGKLVIIDRTEEKVEGQPAGHRISVETVKAEMKAAGLEFVEELNFLSPVQYYLSFKRAE